MLDSIESYKTYTYNFTSVCNNTGNKMKESRDTNGDSNKKTTKESLKKERRKILESMYRLNPYPCKDARKQISQQLQMNPREFQIWFQNRRSREKKKTNMMPINTGLQWINTIEPSYFLKLSSSSSPEMNGNNSNFSPTLSSQSNFEFNSNIVNHSIPLPDTSSSECTLRMSLSYLLI